MKLLNKVKDKLENEKGYDFSSEFWNDEMLTLIFDVVYAAEFEVKNLNIPVVTTGLLDKIDDIEYNSCAQGCGLEDRGIQDRYEAMQHGWEQAIEACREVVVNEL